MAEWKNAPEKIDKIDDQKTVDVVVTLTAQDYKGVSLEAKIQQQTVAQWIADLVNTALIP